MSHIMLGLDLGIDAEPEYVPRFLLHHKTGVAFEGLRFVVISI